MKVSLRLFGVPAVFCLGARSTDGRRLDDASNFDSDIRDRITQCQDDETDFSVKLMFDGGDWYNAKCARSYSRCPLEGGSTCLVGEEHWMAESGQTFEYLETRVSQQMNCNHIMCTLDMISNVPLVCVSDRCFT